MNRTITSLALILLLTTGSFLFLSQCSKPNTQNTGSSQSANQQPQQEPELADYMGKLQYYNHKFALSIEAEHHEAAEFYFHEVRALADLIKEDVPGYEGYDIARFMRIFLDPSLPEVEEALASKDWSSIREKTIEMVDACNNCHNATSHGFVQVTPGWNNNPYNQDFSNQ